MLRTRTISKTTLQWKKQNKQTKHVFFSCLKSAYPFLNSLYPFFEYLSYLWYALTNLKSTRWLCWLYKLLFIFGLLRNLQVISSFTFKCYWLEIRSVTKSPWPFKKWAVKVTHPTPLCLCMHGILVIRTITWLYRLCRIY